jgi:hypothetical protein
MVFVATNFIGALHSLGDRFGITEIALLAPRIETNVL